jgi:transposase-like protein
MDAKPLPRNLLEAVTYFEDLDVCTDFVAKLRWPEGPVCPQCEGTVHSYLASRRVWKCRTCKKQFSIKKGTIFEDSPIGLDKWLVSIWLIANSKNGISSHELGRSVGLTQKSAWFVLHRIRLAMEIGSFDKFDGTVEADETFIGGKLQNMHAYKADQARSSSSGTSRPSRPMRSWSAAAGWRAPTFSTTPSPSNFPPVRTIPRAIGESASERQAAELRRQSPARCPTGATGCGARTPDCS